MLLHGFLGSSLDWAPFVAALRSERSDTNLLALDLPGHGGSDGMDSFCAIPDAAELVLAVADSEQRGASVLVGYSMGARVAIRAALDADPPIGALVSLGGTAGLTDSNERSERVAQDEGRARAIERDGVAAFVASWRRVPLMASQERLPKAIREPMFARRERNRPEGIAESLRLGGTGSMDPMWRGLPGLNLPTLFVAGEEDPKFLDLARRMAAVTPGARAAAIAGAGHAVHVEDPKATAQVIRNFLADRAGSGRS